MAISTGDIKHYLTGAGSDGGAQTNPALSTGNYRSSTEVASGDANVFDDVSGAEASAGDIEYRCTCVKNEHATLSLQNAKVYIQTTTGVADDTIYIAVEVPTGGDTNGTCQTIANESAAPTVNTGNVSNWSQATTYAAGVAVSQGAHDANLDNAEIIFVWHKRDMTAGAVAVTAETYTIAVQGDSAA
jgi:hypothetical protein